MPIDKKRKLSKSAAVQPKRRKTQAVTKKQANVDSLRWKSVEVPEGMDDFEGFYGLEEIEGVDVVKEGDTVKFLAPVKAVQESGDEEFGGFDDEPEASGKPEEAEAEAAVKPVSKDQKKDPKKDSKKDSKKELKGEPKKEAKKAQQKKPKVDEDDQEDPELETNVFANVGDLSEPDEDFDLSEWVPLDLSPQLLSSIARLKFSKPTSIQAAAIPEILSGHDVIGKASTGSGKTLAFGIPIVETWLARLAEKPAEDESKSPIALILSPTRELAHQISDHIKALCAGLTTSPYVCSITGGLSLQKQQRQLEKADIIISTPGRMWEIMSSSNTVMHSLRDISFLVVDEADRLLKDGHFKEAEEIFKALDKAPPTNEDDNQEESEDEESEEEQDTKKRQTLVFSATFNKNLQQKLAGKSKFNLMGDSESLEYLLQKLNFREEKPKFIDANPVSQMAENLKEGLILCGDMEKDLYLYATILLQPCKRTLVFTNSINSVRRLTPLLQELGLPAIPLHSNMIQKARLRSLERFKAAETPNKNNNKKDNKPAASSTPSSAILIATDVAARGLDIPNVDMVIHYHVPRSADDYVHRSGRTARAANSGVSVLLCGPKEAVPTQRLVAKVHASAELKKSGSKKTQNLGSGVVRSIDIDRKVVSRLRERVTIAKKITEAQLAKEKVKKEDDWVKQAAEELGVEYDSEELEKAGNWSGRGRGRKEKEKKVATEVTKGELAVLRAQLRELLAKRVNVGVSERYLTGGAGGVDLDALLRGENVGGFLGRVDGLGLDD
ncbi:ATP-dependent RNA helicase mak-5 [Naviculisporaceae sp. PSN 640]